MRKFLQYILLAGLLATTGCPRPGEVVSNPWLVPFQKRHASDISRSQMRAMARLAHIYKDRGMEKEYGGALTTAVELYAGDRTVTFELLNYLIDGINRTRQNLAGLKSQLARAGVDTKTLSPDALPESEPIRSTAIAYLDLHDKLEAQYKECYRILSNACCQIPYDADLYYRTAGLQFLRADENGDREKYRDAVNYLKRAIASDSGHLESYYLIALCFERLGDKDRAVRFWQLFETIYEVGPQVMGAGFITPDRERLHREAVAHLQQLGAPSEE